jgi:GTPase
VAAKEIEFPRDVSLPGDIPGQVPCVVIVGRPNVGKSSLLNSLARKRIAIVEPTAGVTRDRISHLLEHEDRMFELWDTGGIGTTDDLATEVEFQIELVLSRADLVLFVVDAQEGLVSLDETISRQLRRIGRDVILVANKVDHPKHEQDSYEFLALGHGEPVPICAQHGQGRTDLLDLIVKRMPDRHHASVEDPVMKLSIVGRQNVGKSTFVNTLASEERVIVSELAGTTRDAVDVQFDWKGRKFVAIDTAGLKRKSKSSGNIDFYSLTRAYRAIRRCDVVLLMVDVVSDISKVDKQIAAVLEREHKPCIIAVNKWDTAKDRIAPGNYVDYLNARLPGLANAPVTFISAKDATNIDATIDLAESLFRQSRLEVSTAEINRVMKAAVQLNSPPVRHSKRPKFFYATQIAVGPPTILMFASNPQLIGEQYTRFLQNYFRQELPFPDIPIRLIFRARKRRDIDKESR